MPSLERIRLRFQDALNIKVKEDQWSNIYEFILIVGDDISFAPKREPKPTEIIPGASKVEILRKRVENGDDMWSDKDAKINLE